MYYQEILSRSGKSGQAHQHGHPKRCQERHESGEYRLTVQVSLGSSSESSQSTVQETQAQGSNLTSNGDVNLTATGSGTKDASGKAADGSLNITGSSVSGQNVNLSAAKDISLQSAANTSQSSSTSDSSSAAIGASFAVGTKGNLTGTGIFASGSHGSDNGNETIVTHTDTTVTAQNNLNSASGNDTNLNGAQVTGNKVTMNVGGNLNLVSQQDTDNYTDQNSSSGFNIGTNMASSASESKGNINSTYTSVTTQTGINAGKGGFNINVGKNTDLKGSVIASTATADKNKLSTDTLTYSDINNNADYSASSSGYGVQAATHVEEKDVNGKATFVSEKGLTSSRDIGMPVSGDANSITKSAVSQGTIIVRSGTADLSKLSRNTTDSLHALGKIFDQKTVQEKQQLANLFGQEAYHAIGDLALLLRCLNN
jgi:filamentous hemagglutinin